MVEFGLLFIRFDIVKPHCLRWSQLAAMGVDCRQARWSRRGLYAHWHWNNPWRLC